MKPEFNGIERRLDELNERLTRLEAIKDKPRTEFDQDPYLRNVVERNLEVAAQCCIDISHRIIAIEKAQKPTDYYQAIIMMGELGILPPRFCQQTGTDYRFSEYPRLRIFSHRLGYCLRTPAKA